MLYHISRYLILVVFVSLISACSTTPVAHGPGPEHVATAKRFLHNVGAGELAMIGFKRKYLELATEQPGMSELIRRAFADFKAEDFEDIAAQVYARHLSHEHLIEIAQYTEMPSINYFFRVIFENIASEKPLSNKELISQFSAEQLTDILKFSQSDSFIAMNKSLPEINRELSQASRQLGESRVRDYIKQH
jgi:hypothetical protein